MGKKLKIEDYTGPFSVSFDDGEKISKDIRKYLKTNNKVILDFENVRIFASPFFNALIGHLLKNEGRDSVESSLSLEHINNMGINAYNRAKENAIDYFSDPEKKRHLDSSFQKELREI